MRSTTPTSTSTEVLLLLLLHEGYSVVQHQLLIAKRRIIDYIVSPLKQKSSLVKASIELSKLSRISCFNASTSLFFTFEYARLQDYASRAFYCWSRPNNRRNWKYKKRNLERRSQKLSEESSMSVSPDFFSCDFFSL